MNENKMNLEEFKLPLYNEIPDVGLYLDQVTKYISKYVEVLECITVTPSMISNYVKKKIITNPVKKQYRREQIAELFFIVLAKSVISLEDASAMLHIYRSKYDPEKAYGFFAESIMNSVLRTEQSEVEESSCAEQVFEKRLLKDVATAIGYKVHLEKRFKKLRKN